MASKTKTKFVTVTIDGKTYTLPKDWQALPAKELFTVYEGSLTKTTTALALSNSKVASRYCLGCNKPTCNCDNDKQILSFIAEHPNFRFFKKNPGANTTRRVLVVSDATTQAEIDALFEVVNRAKNCRNGAVSVRGNTLEK